MNLDCSVRWLATINAVVFVMVLCLFCKRQAHGEDWPQWLGPSRDGVWGESGLLEQFPDGGPQLLWQSNCGGGYSGPAVSRGRVFVMDRVTGPTDGSEPYLHKGDVPKNTNFVRQRLPGSERILCLREADGELLWQHEYECPYSSVTAYAIGPRATPTVDNDFVYTLGAEGDLFCLRVDDGDIVWSKNLKSAYDVATPNWGFASPPLVDGDQLICTVGGDGTTCVAFDKHTGEEKWRSLTASEPGYSAPVIRQIGKHRQLIVWDSDAIHGLNPASGEVHWSVAFPSTFAMSVATPQVEGRLIFVMCFNGKCLMLEVAEDGKSATVCWQGDRRKGIDGVHNTPQFSDGYLYGCGSGGRYICADVKSGEQVWTTFAPASTKRPLVWGNVFTVRLAAMQDRYLLVNDHGEIIVASMTPEGYTELDRAMMIEPTHQVGGRKLVWSHPAFANRKVFLRNDKQIRCYSMKAED